MILANGCPKSGTHALMSLCAARGLERLPGIVKSIHPRQRLGVYATDADPEPTPIFGAGERVGYMHGHVRAGAELPDDILVVTIIRDPRDVIISAHRHRKSSIVAAMRNFWGFPFEEVYRAFLGWRETGCQLVRYEDLPRPVGDPGAVYRGASRDNSTLTDSPSDWRTYPAWSEPDVQHEWERIGGPELVEEAGYALEAVA